MSAFPLSSTSAQMFPLLLVGMLACQSDAGTGGAETGESTSLDDTGDLLSGDTAETGDTADPSALDFSDIDALINDFLENTHIPGLGASLVIGGEVVWANGYGWADMENQVPATGDTAFMLASISKTVVATALMQQVEQGVFSLDTPVNDLIDFTLDNPHLKGEEVLVRNLVTHTASLCDNWIWGTPGLEGGLYSEGDSETSLDTLLRAYLLEGGEWYSETNFCPWDVGTRYEYSNIGADLAGYLLEATGDLALDDHSEQHVFGPLGMENTGWHLADLDEANVALPYDWIGGEYISYGHFGYPDYPCGQLRSSARDLGRFLAAYARGGELDGERILESSTVEEIFAKQVPDIEPSQGIFWYWGPFGNRTVVGHSGGDYGVSTEMMLDPETGVGVVVLLNTYGDGPAWSAQVSIEKALFEKGEAILSGGDR